MVSSAANILRHATRSAIKHTLWQWFARVHTSACLIQNSATGNQRDLLHAKEFPYKLDDHECKFLLAAHLGSSSGVTQPRNSFACVILTSMCIINCWYWLPSNNSYPPYFAPQCLHVHPSCQNIDVASAGKGFQANLQDPRFKSLFTSADYALDPTDPRFKQLDGSKAVAQTVAKQHQQHQANDHKSGFTAGPGKKPSADVVGVQSSGVGQNGDAVQLKSMVASLKRKASKQALQQVNSKREVPVEAVKTKKRRVKA